MQKILISLLIGLSIIFAQPIPDDDPPVPPEPMCESELGEHKPREMMETIRIWKLTELLNLTEDQRAKFFPKLQDMRKTRDEFEQKRI
ncbi:MAG: hypothetical protein N2748_03160, partial [candidate division WOR-3 bacterium]|nr:hypothetical protein [candidate division WOR-3 bacterium]